MCNYVVKFVRKRQMDEYNKLPNEEKKDIRYE